MSLSIDQLHLSPVADQAARQLLAACPMVRFTSGRRDLWAQAHTMAVNVMLNRQWIGQTYVAPRNLQAWVDQQPPFICLDGLACGLFDQLIQWSSAELDKLSRHLGGDAFDVLPLIDADGRPTEAGQHVLGVIELLPGLDRLLTHEGGLIRWHVQFIPSVTV